MRTSAAIAILALLSVGLGQAFAGPVGLARNFSVTANPTVKRYDPADAVTCLDKASVAMLHAARVHKNNGWFVHKNSEIQSLIKRVRSGENVPPEEMNQVLERVWLWF